ncbi:MAG: hypothetical protein CME64_00685 [Halobacteriovoraceae bacterium]|nr:hypothetical protein [Halobacteriovoraceae bacterium]
MVYIMKELINSLFDVYESHRPILLKGMNSFGLFKLSSIKESYGQKSVLLKKEYFEFLTQILPHLKSTQDYKQKRREVFEEYAQRETYAKVYDVLENNISSTFGHSDYINTNFSNIVDNDLLKTLLKANYLKVQNNIFDSRIFIAPKSFHANLHFDWRSRVNIFFQIEGEKEFRLYSPDHSVKLGAFLNLGKRDHTVTPEISATLSPGDVLIFPQFYWHEAICHTPCVSASIRLLSNKRFDDWLHNNVPDWRVADLWSRGSLPESSTSKTPLSRSALHESEGEIKNLLERNPSGFKYTSEEQLLRLAYMHGINLGEKFPFRY